LFDEPKFKDFHHGNSWDTGVTDAVSTGQGKATTRACANSTSRRGPTSLIPSPPAPILLTARMRLALELVLTRQAGRLDKGGKPYAAHSLAVAYDVAHLGEHYFIVGCLHDMVEDDEATLEEIQELFGSIVRESVDSISRREYPGGKKEVYMDFICRCKRDTVGREVKLADIRDNTRAERIASLPIAERGIIDRYERAKRLLLE
jgi:hypothetical protein